MEEADSACTLDILHASFHLAFPECVNMHEKLVFSSTIPTEVVIPQLSLRKITVTNDTSSPSSGIDARAISPPLPLKVMKTRPVQLLMQPAEPVSFPSFKSKEPLHSLLSEVPSPLLSLIHI